MLHQCGNNSSSFSIFFPMSSSSSSGGKQQMEEGSSVDCTLSLGTPSTRQTNSSMPTTQRSAPSFCWDIISQSRSSAQSPAPSTPPRLPNAAANSNLGGDPLLLARRCANCDTTSTPLWRNGPRGPKSLCNACGIRYKKEERRAAASSTAAPTEAMGYSYQRQQHQHQQQQQQQQQSWGCYASTADEDMEVPYLSWRLNVVPPTTLFQYQ